MCIRDRVYPLADDALVTRDGRPHQFRGELQAGIFVEIRSEDLFRQLHTIAHHTREADLQRVTIRAHGLDLHALARLGGFDDDSLCRELKGNPQHVGVFHIEQAFLVQVIGLTPQGTTDDLLAQQLGTELSLIHIFWHKK